MEVGGGQKLKKYIRIVLVLSCILALTACGNKKEIVLPEAKNITEIKIMDNASETANKIIDEKEISKLISDIKNNSKGTNAKSVNDQPTNIENYIIVKFYHKGEEKSPSVAYLYQKNGNSYVEQPYQGIWDLKEEIFNNIRGLISESDNKKAGIEASYKPMVKINDEIYGWVRDLGAVKLGDIEFLGEIKGSKASLSKTLNDEDENFTSNIYPIGAKIYKWGEKSILIESNDIFRVCEIIE
nr:DUF5301 domain-containing protein [uncultured Peptostreptococcus sp.]